MGPRRQVHRAVTTSLEDQSPESKAQDFSQGRLEFSRVSCFLPFYSKHFNLADVRSRRDLNGKNQEGDV